MPPFVSAECTNPKCRHKNRFDLAEWIVPSSPLSDQGERLEKFFGEME